MYRYVLLVLVCGCGLDRNVQPTIQQGVYGLLASGGDQPAPDVHVSVYAAGQKSADAYEGATSDGDGVYQIALPAGDYTLCTQSCTPITVPAHATVRFDWTSGPGGGHWQQI